VTVTDLDGFSEIVSATVTLTNAKAGDQLVFANTDKITGSYSVSNGVGTLTLSNINGQAPTNADFQNALQTVRFNNSSDTPDTTQRSITFKASDANATSTAILTETVNEEATNDA
jgi:hypothetical protein